MNGLLIGFQVGLSFVLLVCAGLFVRTLQKLRVLDAGFDRDVVQLSINAAPGYSPAQAWRVTKEIVSRLESVPGVNVASYSSLSMLERAIHMDSLQTGPGTYVQAQVFNAGPKFFETVGRPLLRGREFLLSDESPDKTVGSIIVNQTVAAKYFAGENPVGKHIRFSGNDVEIIGVARDGKYHSLREQTPPAVYVPFSAGGFPQNFDLRVSGDLPLVASGIRRAVNSVSPRLEIRALETMRNVADRTLLQERLAAELAAGFGAIGLFLTCLGLFGTLSYAVTQRTREIGVRIALGARIPAVTSLVLHQAFLMIAAGIVFGSIAAPVLTRMIAAMLFGIEPNDPVALSVAALIIIGVAAVAAYFPVRRASKIDPVIALRHE